MRVIDRKAAHARQAGQLAALLVAVDRAELGQPQGQVAVAARLAAVDLDVVGAVHRLEQELLLIDGDGRVLAVLVVGVVAAGLVQLQIADVGRDDRQIAALQLRLAQEALQVLAQHRAVGQPQRQARPDQRRDVEQAQLLAQPAMIAGFGLLQPLQVLVQLRLVVPGRAVDALQLRPFSSPRQ